MPNVMLNIDIEDIEKIDAIVLERNAQRIDRRSIAKKFSPVLTADDLDKAHKLRKERGIGAANKFLKELSDRQREEAMAMQPRASRTNIALEMVTRGLAAHSAKHAPNPVRAGVRKHVSVNDELNHYANLHRAEKSERIKRKVLNATLKRKAAESLAGADGKLAPPFIKKRSKRKPPKAQAPAPSHQAVESENPQA